MARKVHIGEILLVAHEQGDDLLVGGIGLGLLDPLLDVVETVAAGYIVDQDCSDRAAVVRSRNRLVDLLPGLYCISITVSQICSLSGLSLMVIVFDPNSTPMVGSDSILNRRSKNWRRMQDFPTPG
jgi:hypothetical protein